MKHPRKDLVFKNGKNISIYKNHISGAYFIETLTEAFQCSKEIAKLYMRNAATYDTAPSVHVPHPHPTQAIGTTSRQKGCYILFLVAVIFLLCLWFAAIILEVNTLFH